MLEINNKQELKANPKQDKDLNLLFVDEVRNTETIEDISVNVLELVEENIVKPSSNNDNHEHFIEVDLPVITATNNSEIDKLNEVLVKKSNLQTAKSIEELMIDLSNLQDTSDSSALRVLIDSLLDKLHEHLIQEANRTWEEEQRQKDELKRIEDIKQEDIKREKQELSDKKICDLEAQIDNLLQVLSHGNISDQASSSLQNILWNLKSQISSIS